MAVMPLTITVPKTHHHHKPLHMESNYKALGRWKKNIMSKETWYKNKSESQESVGGQKKIFQMAGVKRNSGAIPTSTVIFIPSSKGCTPMKLMRDIGYIKSELTAQLVFAEILYFSAVSL